MCLSTSHRPTTWTVGSTWRRRKREHLPYQPVPMTPTRRGLVGGSAAYRPDRAKPEAAEVERKSRRFMGEFLGWGQGRGRRGQDSPAGKRWRGDGCGVKTRTAMEHG